MPPPFLLRRHAAAFVIAITPYAMLPGHITRYVDAAADAFAAITPYAARITNVSLRHMPPPATYMPSANAPI